MKKSFIALFITVCSLVLVLPAHPHAATPTPRPTAKPTPHKYTVIQSVDASSITVQEPTATTTYKITPQTEITFKGNTATVNDLKVGMRVDVTAGMDPTVADRIAAEDPPKKK